MPAEGLEPQWSLSQAFSINASGQFDGNLLDYRVLLNWQPKSCLGLGVGYDHFSFDVNVDSSNFRGKMDWAYHGPMIFYTASF